jgi:hypothetical protein
MSIVPVLEPALFDLNFKYTSDPPLPLLRRRSQSDGAITYTSSNPNIARIVPVPPSTLVDRNGDTLYYDNVIEIVGVRDLTYIQDSTVITISQAASGIYAATSTSATYFFRRVQAALYNFPAQIVKDTLTSSFTITPPSSNNPSGAFTYTSSNNNVAEVLGNTIVINGVGSTIITVRQEQDLKFLQSNALSAVLVVNKATPVFFGITDLVKITTDASFILVPPTSTNTVGIFTFLSEFPDIVSIRENNGIARGIINSAGVTRITVTQAETEKFFSQTQTFVVTVNDITNSIINCNLNFVFSNPHQDGLWARYKPVCYPSTTFTSTQLDERRKAEILKYQKSVGGLTKSQKYAKAARGELLRKKGFAVQTDTYTNPNVSGLPIVGGSIICNRPPVLCGLTTACNVPGKEMTLCYDQNVPLYNFTKVYTYKGGLQTTTNIPTLALTAPTNLTAVRGNRRITISWFAPESNGGFPINAYVITLSSDYKTWKPYASILVNSAFTYPYAHDISGLEHNTLYYLSVYASNQNGLSAFPASVTQSTFSVPSAPSNVVMTGGNDISIPVTWQAPVDTGGPPLGGYKLEYTTNINSEWSYKLVTSNTGGEPPNTFILNGVDNQTTYYVRVSAFNTLIPGYSAASPIVSTSTMVAPSAPTRLSATAVYTTVLIDGVSQMGHLITLAWLPPSYNGGTTLTSFSIEYASDAAFSVDSSTYTYNLSTSNNNNSSYTYDITKINARLLGSGQTYYFRVYARNKKIVSPFSNVVSIKTVTTPDIPYGLTSTRSTAGVTIGFSIVSNGGSPLTQIIINYTSNNITSSHTVNLTYDIGVGILSTFLPALTTDTPPAVLLNENSTYSISMYVRNIIGSSAISTDTTIVGPIVYN